jgi:surface antigen
MLKLGFIKKTKTMKNKRTTSLWYRLTSAGSLVVIGCSILGSVAIVHADQFTQQIQSLQDQNSQTQQSVNQLQSQAGTYQAAIGQLQSQIDSIQSNISSNQTEQTSLQDQIQADNNKLVEQKGLLGDDIKAMYAEGQLTPIEMLATSKNLSAYVDQQAYQQAVQDKIQLTLNQIADLQVKLKTQQEQVGQLITALQGQQSQLDAAEAQQSQLLSYNQSQQDQYNAQLQSNSAQISKLQAEELAANQSGVTKTIVQGAACGPTSGPYPNTYPSYLCNAPQDSIVDQWNMYNRECVSYTAWMAANESSIANTLLQAHNFGNATNWPANAVKYGSAYGVTVDTTPSPGSIAIRLAVPGATIDGEGDVGHAMYVDAVNGDGTITVSQYNEQLNGEFSIQVRQAGGLEYIHFPKN